MNRLGGDPARVVLEPVGGQGPQKLVTEAGEAILAALEAPTPAEAGLAAASLPFELVVRGSTAGPPA